MRDRPIIVVKLHAPGDPKTKGKTGNKGEVLDITDKILSLRFEDDERKADLLEITLDNQDLVELDNPAWKKGGILEVSWGYPGEMTPPRRAVIQKVAGGRELKIEAHGLEVLMNKVKSIKVMNGKTLYELAKEYSDLYQGAFNGLKTLDDQVAARKSTTARPKGFDDWYDSLAKHIGLDPDPDDPRHFYDWKGLYRDVSSGKFGASINSRADLPNGYRRPVPSYFIQNSDGRLIDSRTGAEASYVGIREVVQEKDNIDDSAKYIKLNSVAQSAQTNAQVLSKLARRYGYLFYIDHEGFHFKQRDAVYKKKPEKVLTWFHGEGEWLDFSYEHDDTGKSHEIVHKGIDAANKKTFETKADNEETKRNGLAARQREWSQSSGDQVLVDAPTTTAAAPTSPAASAPTFGRDEERDVTHFSGTDPALAKASADGKYRKRRGHAHGLTGKLVGDPKFLAKTVLQVEGIGRRLSGKWAVKKVTHHIDSHSGYTCDFQAERDGDNGYGQKGETKSKAQLNKQDAPKKDADGPLVERKWDQRTGVLNLVKRE